MTENKNLHKGHRNRLRTKMRNTDSDMFEPHELLEFLLYSVMSQKNTNELAHDLLNHFNNSIADVFNAPAEELMKIKGIGLQSALMLNTIPILARLYFASKNEKKLKLTSHNISSYCQKAAGQTDNECIIITYLNAKSEVIDEKILTDNIFTKDSLIDMRVLVSQIINSHAASILFIHRFGTPNQIINQNIRSNINSISLYLTAFNIKFIDYVVISNTDFISMRTSESVQNGK